MSNDICSDILKIFFNIIQFEAKPNPFPTNNSSKSLGIFVLKQQKRKQKFSLFFEKYFLKKPIPRLPSLRSLLAKHCG
jgi:hypothetical protein